MLDIDGRSAQVVMFWPVADVKLSLFQSDAKIYKYFHKIEIDITLFSYLANNK